MTSTNWDGYEISLAPREPQSSRPPLETPAGQILTPRWDHLETSSCRPVPTRRDDLETPACRLLATRWYRLVAAGIDKLIYLTPLITAYIAARCADENVRTTHLRAGCWIVTWLIVLAVQWTLLSVRGQSIGKFLLGLRIVDAEDGSNAGFLRAVVQRSVLPTLIGAIPIVGKFFLLADPLAILGKDHQCLHDVMARTMVVDLINGSNKDL